ncbi:hypothetical protein E2562_005050 [Oryza meyeriana var. granulata]|uniref:Uncharacterized protein n=1 Tax=Oryza meyeriana var. granulata TaxID=110450 RepID=A0A6G1BU28_9ORYZ|nr:hypothetical protein E2562_005050 [Oryza meyeriana var. granulata]
MAGNAGGGRKQRWRRASLYQILRRPDHYRRLRARATALPVAPSVTGCSGTFPSLSGLNAVRDGSLWQRLLSLTAL